MSGQSRLQGKAHVERVAVTSHLARMDARGLGQQQLNKSASVIMGLKWACDNLKAASVVSVKTRVMRTLRLFAWWVHTVLCSAGSSHSHDWAEGSYCNLP